MSIVSRIFVVFGFALLIAAAIPQSLRDAILPAPSPSEEREANRPDNPDEALKFRNLQLRDENGKIPVDGLLKGKAQMEVMKEALQRRAAATGDGAGLAVANIMPNDWVSVGPGNIGGRIRALVIHPTNVDKIWIGSPSGGIWSTTNGGTSWYPVNDFMANLAVSTMVIDPTNPNVLYAGTGESFASAGFRGLGVFKSTDGGVTWNQLASTNPAITPPPPGCGNGAVPCPDFWFYVNRLAISPDGATILAATGNGIARSTDGGASWTQKGFVLTQDIAFRPGDSTQAIRGLLGEVRYSTDGGATWTAATFNPAITAGKHEFDEWKSGAGVCGEWQSADRVRFREQQRRRSVSEHGRRANL